MLESTLTWIVELLVCELLDAFVCAEDENVSLVPLSSLSRSLHRLALLSNASQVFYLSSGQSMFGWPKIPRTILN